MINDPSGWSLRSVLISVSDLNRSMSFYQDLMNIEELERDNRMAVLGTKVTGSLMVILREASRSAVRRGQQSLSLRAFSSDVGSTAELDLVEERLRVLGAFQARQLVGDAMGIVHGRDPDRLPLTFVAFEGGETVSPVYYHSALLKMYDIDI